MNSLIFKFLRYSGLVSYFKNIHQKNTVTILLYHDPNPAVIEKQFKYLLKEYNIISLNDFMLSHKNQDSKTLPSKSLIITFDDGHKRNFELLPIIKKLQIPVTIFLCSEIIGTNRHFWFKGNSSNKAKLKKVNNDERLKLLNDQGFQQEKEYEDRQALSIEEIKIMSDYIDFQSHTRFHPCLPNCSKEVAEEEIRKSKTKLEYILSKEINSISYPNGDYSARDINFSKEFGYNSGITVDYGFNSIHTDIFKLKRVSVNDTENMDEFIVKSSGLWAHIQR